MRERRRFPISGLALMTGALALLLIGGHLSAQTPPSGQTAPSATPLEVLAPSGAETFDLAPRLFAGPNGQVLRLWYRARTQTGGLVLAVASPSHVWQTLLEIVPQEPSASAGAPDLAVGPAGELRVAYQWWRRAAPSSKQIRLARSDDGGKTWTDPPTPLDSSGKAFQPKVRWGRGQNLVVAWSDEYRAKRGWDIYARRSPNGGATWQPEQLLSHFPQQTVADFHHRPELVSDNENRFWVVWIGFRSGRSRLYLNRSTDGGQTWTDPVELSGQSQSVFNQRLVRFGERLVLVWEDRRTGHGRIFSVSSADGGVTWTSPTRVDHLPTDLATDAVAPAVVMSPSAEVIVAWHDGRHGRDDIFVGRSLDGGRTWGNTDIRLDMDEPGTGVSRFSNIARAPDGRIAVAWDDDRAGYEGVYLRVRGTGEQPAWGPEMRVESPGPKKAARMPVLIWGTDGSLYVAWEVWDHTGGPLAITKRIDGRTLVFDKK